MFDYSDFYSLTVFDIYKKSERFICTIAAYAIISDKKLNFDTFIERDNSDQFIIVVKNATNKKRRLQLKSIFIVYQRIIVCRDISCFRVRIFSFKNLQYIVKFF